MTDRPDDTPRPLALMAALGVLAVVALAWGVHQRGQQPAPTTTLEPSAQPDDHRASGPDRSKGASRPTTAQEPAVLSTPEQGGPGDPPASGVDADPLAPSPLVAQAMRAPRMANMDPDAPEYSPRHDARQHFSLVEERLAQLGELDPDSVQEALAESGAERRATERAQELRASGHAEAADMMMDEWSRLRRDLQRRAVLATEGPTAP